MIILLCVHDKAYAMDLDEIDRASAGEDVLRPCFLEQGNWSECARQLNVYEQPPAANAQGNFKKRIRTNACSECARQLNVRILQNNKSSIRTNACSECARQLNVYEQPPTTAQGHDECPKLRLCGPKGLHDSVNGGSVTCQYRKSKG